MPIYSFVCTNPDCPTNLLLLEGKQDEAGFENLMSVSDYSDLPENEGGQKILKSCPECKVGHAVRVMDMTAFTINDFTRFSSMLKKRSDDDSTKNSSKYLEQMTSGERNYAPNTKAGQDIIAAKKGMK